jgi:pyruvate/2-oxoglutarate/acetoin dehydrogenase E1 component
VFDNLFDEEIVQSVQTTLTIQEQQKSEDLAQKIAQNIPSEASKVLFNNIIEVFGFDTSHIRQRMIRKESPFRRAVELAYVQKR